MGGISVSAARRDTRSPVWRDRTTRLVLRAQHQPVPNSLFLSHCAHVLHLGHLLSSCRSSDPRNDRPDFAVLPWRDFTAVVSYLRRLLFINWFCSIGPPTYGPKSWENFWFFFVDFNPFFVISKTTIPFTILQFYLVLFIFYSDINYCSFIRF